MKSAEEMRRLSEESRQATWAKQKEDVREFAEEVLTPKIEEAAKLGLNKICFTLPVDITYSYLRDFLSEYEYKLTSDSDKYTVSW